MSSKEAGGVSSVQRGVMVSSGLVFIWSALARGMERA